jgi:hypothetical protein
VRPEDADTGEVDDLDSLSDRDLDGLLAGSQSVGDRDVERLCRFLAEWKALDAKPPPRHVEATHLRQITELARGVATSPEPVDLPAAIDSVRPRRKVMRKRLAVAIVGLAIAVPLFTAGLAVAGVSLPEVARAPFDQVGVTLPNQSQADAVRSVIESTPTDQRGCDFGQQVAAAASNGSAQPHGNPCDQGGGNGTDQNGGANPASNHNQGGAGNPSGGQTFGQSTAADAQQNASEDGRAFGERTSQAAQQLGQEQSQTGQEQSQTGLEQSQTGLEPSQTGQATGQSQAEQGQSTGAGASQGHGP